MSSSWTLIRPDEGVDGRDGRAAGTDVELSTTRKKRRHADKTCNEVLAKNVLV